MREDPQKGAGKKEERNRPEEGKGEDKRTDRRVKT
jgi:hypothetical protein